METGISLTATSPSGEPLQARFLPEKGMNMISYKRGNLEIIDQSTKPLFVERFAGLGAMIGPHFHHRKPEAIPRVPNEEAFPHIALLKKKGVTEPFSHGIGRYAPWKIVEASDTKLKAQLEGDDQWHGVKLRDLEGQSFKMTYQAMMTPQGLAIQLSCVSDAPSVVGLHTYYALREGKGKVIAQVQERYNDKGQFLPIPSTWNYEKDHTLTLSMGEEEIDFGFLPFPHRLHGVIQLETSTHRVVVSYNCETEENSFQIWHPSGQSFVCIEPLSARNPRDLHVTGSELRILMSIV